MSRLVWNINECVHNNIVNVPKGFQLLICNFGHIGDQNLHLNILLSAISFDKHNSSEAIVEGEGLTLAQIAEVQKVLDGIVYSRVIEYNGKLNIL